MIIRNTPEALIELIYNDNSKIIRITPTFEVYVRKLGSYNWFFIKQSSKDKAIHSSLSLLFSQKARLAKGKAILFKYGYNKASRRIYKNKPYPPLSQLPLSL